MLDGEYRLFKVLPTDFVENEDGTMTFRRVFLMDTETGNRYEAKMETFTRARLVQEGAELVVASAMTSRLR